MPDLKNFLVATLWRCSHLENSVTIYVYKKIKNTCSKIVLGSIQDVLVLSSHISKWGKPILVDSQGKSRLDSEASSFGCPWAVDMSCMLFCPHVYHVIQLSFYFKIIQGWSTVILSSSMGMTCPFFMDVDWHCVVKCGILAVTVHIYDRWVQKQFNKLK